jgi:hypothetical protein
MKSILSASIVLILFLASSCGGDGKKAKDDQLTIKSDEVVNLQGSSSSAFRNVVETETPEPEKPRPPRPESETILQDFEEDNGTANHDVYTWDYGKAKSEVQAARAFRGQRSLRTYGEKFGINLSRREFNVIGYDKVFVYIYDTVGDNTVEFELHDMDGGSAKVWSVERSEKNEWQRVAIPLEYFRGKIDLKRLKNVEFYEWNPGVYYLDNFGVSKYKD